MKEGNWKQYFNEKAATFGGSVKTSDYFDEKSFYTQRDNTLKLLGPLRGKVILDAGCGVGAFSEPLVKENTVHGVDFSEKSLQFAKERGLLTTCGDLGSLPFEDGKFDVILCIGVIQLIPEYQSVVKELYRVLKPGGILLLETLNRNSMQRKLLRLVDKSKKFDLMFDMNQLSKLYGEMGLRDIRFMNLYHPFSRVTHSKKQGPVSNLFSTSFAIMGVKGR